ncbi:MAG: hypothetical protein ACYTEX_24535 [Planctomycetota bacterium]|jgi:hypothetical protein
MGYFVRVFCRTEKVPTIGEVLNWVRARNIVLAASVGAKGVDVHSNKWERIELKYKEGNNPIVVEISEDTGLQDCLFRKEIEEFIEMLAHVSPSLATRKVTKHLQKSKFIVANQLLSDIDEEGYMANDALLAYFVKYCQGMIQADGEGFYKGTKLIVEENQGRSPP